MEDENKRMMLKRHAGYSEWSNIHMIVIPDKREEERDRSST
jgi:hypothetical protein